MVGAHTGLVAHGCATSAAAHHASAEEAGTVGLKSGHSFLPNRPLSRRERGVCGEDAATSIEGGTSDRPGVNNVAVQL